MSGQYYFDEKKIYRCCRCGEQYAVGHSLNCDGPKLKKERMKIRNEKAENERTAKALEEGFDMMQASEE